MALYAVTHLHKKLSHVVRLISLNSISKETKNPLCRTTGELLAEAGGEGAEHD